MTNDRSPTTNDYLFLALFTGSGAAALIYEVVWQQLLQLVIGSSTVSLGVLLGVFMGGMCVGSLVAPRLQWCRCHPIRAYAIRRVQSTGHSVRFTKPGAS